MYFFVLPAEKKQSQNKTRGCDITGLWHTRIIYPHPPLLPAMLPDACPHGDQPAITPYAGWIIEYAIRCLYRGVVFANPRPRFYFNRSPIWALKN